jgi:hypothetical protein
MTHDRNTQETWCSLLTQQESKSISQRGDFFARIFKVFIAIFGQALLELDSFLL